MRVLRALDGVLLEDVCAVEDAEVLVQDLQGDATFIDWSGCTPLAFKSFWRRDAVRRSNNAGDLISY